jgi:hypothetical protein
MKSASKEDLRRAVSSAYQVLVDDRDIDRAIEILSAVTGLPNKIEFYPLEYLLLQGVRESVANDWLALRKARRAPATKTAITHIAIQAQKAGLLLETALAMCCQRGWQGFEAKWLLGAPEEKRKQASDALCGRGPLGYIDAPHPIEKSDLYPHEFGR